ncbi:MAG: SSU ribosomal protein S8p (S15Ae), partial [uncultured Acidimicrobiales bacterium]
DDDRPDRRHAHASAQRQPGVPRRCHDAVQQAQAGRRGDPPAGGLHHLLRRRRARRGPGGQDAPHHPQVRPQPRALDRRRPPHQQARPPGLRQEHGPAQGARRTRRRDHLDEPGPADRPPGEQEGRGWGSPRLRLV